jgi:hypothetical protein
MKTLAPGTPQLLWDPHTLVSIVGGTACNWPSTDEMLPRNYSLNFKSPTLSDINGILNSPPTSFKLLCHNIRVRHF